MYSPKSATLCFSFYTAFQGKIHHALWSWSINIPILPTGILILYRHRYPTLSCTLTESHMLIGCLLPGMNSYSFLEMQKKVISPLGWRCASHIPSWAIKHISYPLLIGNQVYYSYCVYATIATMAIIVMVAMIENPNYLSYCAIIAIENIYYSYSTHNRHNSTYDQYLRQ